MSASVEVIFTNFFDITRRQKKINLIFRWENCPILCTFFFAKQISFACGSGHTNNQNDFASEYTSIAAITNNDSKRPLSLIFSSNFEIMSEANCDDFSKFAIQLVVKLNVVFFVCKLCFYFFFYDWIICGFMIDLHKYSHENTCIFFTLKKNPFRCLWFLISDKYDLFEIENDKIANSEKEKQKLE